jgi:regulatory protein YycI of two-component signal transduction system YycFG
LREAIDMDWKRAKTILIIIFLVINILLSYQLFATGKNQYRYTDSEELKSIQQYLISKNIDLKTEIPDKAPVIPSLRVKYSSFDVERVKKMFFEGKEPKLTQFSDGYALDSGDISVEVKNGIYLTYKNNAIKIKQGEVRKEKGLSQIDRFIEGLKLDIGNRYTKVSEIKDGYMKMVLGQQYKNIPVENSQIEIVTTEEGVAEAKVNWFEWIKADSKLNITTPVVALLTAFEKTKASETPIIIKQIRQGYYFNISNQGGASEGEALEGIVFPMWVIETDKNQIYINAYNEKFEKVQ